MTHAGAVSALPLSPLGTQFDVPFTIDGLADASASDRPRAAYRAVLAGYFETMAIPLVKGRLFDRFDGREKGPRVAIINETVAKRYFSGSRSAEQGGEDPHGRRSDHRRRGR